MEEPFKDVAVLRLTVKHTTVTIKRKLKQKTPECLILS